MPNTNRPGMPANIDVDAFKNVTERNVGLLFAPSRLLFARRIVASLCPNPDSELRTLRIIKSLGIGR